MAKLIRKDRHRRRLLRFERCEPRLLLAAPEFADGEVMGTVELTDISAASGLIASREHAGVLWTHNDSGDSRLFAMDSHGRHLGVYSTGLPANDWEDLAIGPGPIVGVDYLYIADTGDNAQTRSEIVVHRAIEPEISSDQQPTNGTVTGAEAIRLRYPDEPHDAEALIVDPVTRDLYLFTKRDTRSRVYRAAYPQSTTSTTTLAFVGELSWAEAASGDISPDGDEIILKNLGDVFYYPRPTGTTIAQALQATPQPLPYISQPLGEGLTFDAQGAGYFTNSEGSRQALYYYARLSTTTADVTGDGRVDRRDMAVLAKHFGMTGAALAQGDIDGNGDVSLKDLVAMQTQFTPVAASQAAASLSAEASSDEERIDGGARANVRGERRVLRVDLADRVFTAGGTDDLWHSAIGTRRSISGRRPQR